jgi:hypothetical protein
MVKQPDATRGTGHIDSDNRPNPLMTDIDAIPNTESTHENTAAAHRTASRINHTMPMQNMSFSGTSLRSLGGREQGIMIART